MGGYYTLFLALRYQANAELQVHLDANDYPASDALTIKMPITLPYQINGAGFERLTGEFEYQGEFYKLVKQKLENDTLIVVCIKDHKEKQLVGTMADFTKMSNDLPANSTTLKLIGNFLKEYNSIDTLEMICCKGWNENIFFRDPSFAMLSPNIPVHSPPPKSIC